MNGLHNAFGTVRTGRANAMVLDRIKVDYYGVPTPINQMAGVKTPDAHMLVIEPWDKGVLGAIEHAIMESDLGVTPNNDGSVIRLPFPALTEDRRRELVKQCKEYAEEARVAIRNARRDAQHAMSPSPSRKTTFPRTSSVAPRLRSRSSPTSTSPKSMRCSRRRRPRSWRSRSGVRLPASSLFGAAGAPAHRALVACVGAAGCRLSAQSGRRWGSGPCFRPAHLRSPRNPGSQPGCVIRLL